MSILGRQGRHRANNGLEAYLQPDPKQPMMETVWLSDPRLKVCCRLFLPGVDEDEAGGWTVDGGLDDQNRGK